MFGLFGMLWDRQDFIGNSFPPEVCEKILKSIQLISTLNPSGIISGMTASEFSVVCCAADYPKHGNEPTVSCKPYRFCAARRSAVKASAVTVAEIAAQLNVSVPAVSRTLRSLQEKGWIERQIDENDRRNVRVIVTKAGQEIMEENLSRITAAMNQILSVFTEDEIRTIAELYSKFANASTTLAQLPQERRTDAP